MDIEKPLRQEIKKILEESFDLFDEIKIVYDKDHRSTRADIIALPKSIDFSDQTFAIEVKLPNEKWQAKNWSYAAKQAYDYIGGTITSSEKKIDGRKIDAAFVFPAPDYHCPNGSEYDYIIQGIFQLAAQFRVGRATRANESICKLFTLSFGATDIWNTKGGWTSHAVGLLKNKIRHGSGKISR